MPKAFTEQEKELIRTRLLEQGHKQFSAYGLRKTNIEELAEAAGISKGAFYLFYASKEALFMEVVEQVEQRFRQELFAMIDLPGPSPRARLFALLQQVFHRLKTIPLLRFLTGTDYDLLVRRVPLETFQEHLVNDRVFLNELITRCSNAGIPLRVQPEEMISLLYPLVLTILHEDEYAGVFSPGGSVDVLLELIAAVFLGEIELQLQPSGTFSPSPES
ncbi:MAG TPA: TetR/AcrR family transcriptional regulator [Ktedonobacteraceae bacterium]|nr:TetR/AcrR family transcriptional regulator [Ktedonobacteraceae bacterium]